MNLEKIEKGKTEKIGELSFDLVSNGKTGKEWSLYLPTKGFQVSRNAQKMLESQDFRPTAEGTIHQVRLLKGSAFSDAERTTRLVRSAGQSREWRIPHPEVAPLLRDLLSDEQIRELGLEEIVTFHEPIFGRFLDIDTETGELESAPAGDDDSWHKSHGFAFEL